MQKKTTKFRVTLTALAAVCCLGVGFAERPIAEPENPVSVQDVVRLAVAQNLDLQGTQFAVREAEARVEEAKGAFAPVLTARYNQEYDPQISAYQNTPFGMNQTNAYAGVHKKLANGTTVGVGYQYDQQVNGVFIGPINAVQSGTLYAPSGAVVGEIHMPLMRGRGRAVNMAPVDEARLSAKIAQLSYEEKASEVAAMAERTWWHLALSRRMLDIQHVSAERTQQYVTLLRKRIRAGLAAPYEEEMGLQSLAQAESGVAQARKSMLTSTQELRHLVQSPRVALQILGMLDDNRPTVQPVSLEVAERDVPQVAQSDVNRDVDEALQRRYDLQRARLEVDRMALDLTVQKDEGRPQLDLVGRSGMAFNGSPVWQVGVQFEKTLGPSTHARADEAADRLKQAQLVVQRLQDEIQVDVSEAAARLSVQQSEVEAAHAATVAAEAHLAAEAKRFRVGLTNAYAVFEAQQRALDAEREEATAITDLKVAQVDLDHTVGRSLDKYQIAIEPAGVEH